MIGQLRGKLVEKQPPTLLLDVQGVGYYLQAPLSTFFVLPELGQEVTLCTHFIVREDAHLLFGFITSQERQLFQAIIKVSGVGPKIALAILSALSVREFIEVIADQQIARLQGIPGIGMKTAQRLLIELQHLSNQVLKSPQGRGGAQQEAIEALITLGYKAQEATKAVAKVQNMTSCETIIKEALQGLAKV